MIITPLPDRRVSRFFSTGVMAGTHDPNIQQEPANIRPECTPTCPTEADLMSGFCRTKKAGKSAADLHPISAHCQW